MAWFAGLDRARSGLGGVWQHRSVRAVVSRDFVGRAAEMAVFAAAAAEAAAGRPGFVLVGGEAGVGKSRLVDEASTRAAEGGFRVLVGRCVELGLEGVPFAPLRDALRELGRLGAGQPPDEFLGVAGSPLAQLVPGLDPTPAPMGGSLDSSRGPAQLLELLLGLIERLSSTDPLLLIIEDLHWADQSTLDLLAYLVRALRSARVLVVCTFRADELHRRHRLRPLLSDWERIRSVQRIELARFDRSEVAAQLRAILPESPDTSLIDRVFERSGGNAFLVEEIADAVASGGDPNTMSTSLREVLLSRVDRLDEPARRVLRAASGAGQDVPDRLLAAVAGLDPATFLGALRELVEGHLLVVDDSGRGYAFRHALARDAVYEDMLPGERVLVHAAYGEALECQPTLADDDSVVDATLAYHWYAALDLPRALSASVNAARLAVTFGPAEASTHFERALQIWPRVADAEARTGIDHIEVLRLSAGAAYQAGDVGRARSLIDQALREVVATADDRSRRERQAVLEVARVRIAFGAGHQSGDLDRLPAALDALPPEPPSTTRAMVLATLANLLLRRGRHVRGPTPRRRCRGRGSRRWRSNHRGRRSGHFGGRPGVPR